MSVSQTYASDILEVVTDSGGEYIVDLDGALIFNKLKGGRYARLDEVAGVELSPFVDTLVGKPTSDSGFHRHDAVTGVPMGRFVDRDGEGEA